MIIVRKLNHSNGSIIETEYSQDEHHVALWDAHQYNNCGDQPFSAKVIVK